MMLLFPLPRVVAILLSTSRYAIVTARSSPGLPLVINTWGGPFTAATDAAFSVIADSSAKTPMTALDAVQIGCTTCERNQCDGSVGFGGSPDENCETTLDAMIMDGTTLKSGAVAGLRRVRDAIAVARLVLDHTEHTMLAGDLATRFAVDFGGFVEEDLTTIESKAKCEAWRAGECQPNYWVGGVLPDPRRSCGPYSPVQLGESSGSNTRQLEADLKMKARSYDYKTSQGRSHDTISMVAIHTDGTMAAGTSTNGAVHKISGRIGDGPITGSGSYVDGEVGGCGATGDGDIMMRFLPCYQVVESMRRGMTPQEAAEDAVRRMIRKYPEASTGIVAVNNAGDHGGAGSGWTFTYSFRGGRMDATETVTVPPLQART